MKFSWHGRDASGERVSGELEAASAHEVAEALSRSGIMPLAIEKSTPKSVLSSVRSFWNRLQSIGTLPLRKKALFYRQLAALVASGIPLNSACASLSRSEVYPPLAARIRAAQRNLDAGTSLSESLFKSALAGVLEKTLLAAGEESGRLGETLDLLARLCERKESLRGKVLSALFYPCIVLCLAGGVVCVMFRLILPRFEEAFTRMNLPLPPVTARLLLLSRNFWSILWALCGLCVFLYACWRCAKHFPRTRLMIDRLRLRLPVTGKIVRCAALSRTLRSLGVMLQAGVPLLRAGELAADVSGNSAVAEAFGALHDAALEGRSLESAAERFSFFRPVAYQLIAAGERSGTLDNMLLKAAEWYESDLEEGIKRLGALLEPLLTLFVGGIAALVAAGLFAPVLHSVQELSAGVP